MNASVAIQSLPKAANDEELIRIVDLVIIPFNGCLKGTYIIV